MDIEKLKEKYSTLISHIPREMYDKIQSLRNSSQQSFREKILEQAERRRNKNSVNDDAINRVKAIGGEICY